MPVDVRAALQRRSEASMNAIIGLACLHDASPADLEDFEWWIVSDPDAEELVVEVEAATPGFLTPPQCQNAIPPAEEAGRHPIRVRIAPGIRGTLIVELPNGEPVDFVYWVGWDVGTAVAAVCCG